MIVKNEERYLASAIGSIRDICSQLIVVDTGSTDKTPEIAKRFEAEVYHFEWCDDFSAARNFSLEKATQPWILALDGDEVIASKDLSKLTSYLNDQTCAYTLAKRHYTTKLSTNGYIPNHAEYIALEKGTGYFVSSNILLFPNRTDVRYRGHVHELVEKSVGEAGLSVVECPVPIHHYGHLDDSRRAERGALYQSLGQKKIENNAECWKSHYELGVQLYHNRDIRSAIEHLELSLKLNPNFARAWSDLGFLYVQAKRPEDAQTLLEKAVQRFPNSSDCHLNLGKVFLELEQYQKSKEASSKAVKLNHDLILAFRNLTLAYMKLEDFAGAISAATEALQHHPRDPGLLSNRGHAYFFLEKFQEARNDLEQSHQADPRVPETLLSLAEVEKIVGNTHAAGKALLQYCELLEQSSKSSIPLPTLQKLREEALVLLEQPK